MRRRNWPIQPGEIYVDDIGFLARVKLVRRVSVIYTLVNKNGTELTRDDGTALILVCTHHTFRSTFCRKELP